MNSNMGQSTWKSKKECIGIRAQLRNPINKQLPGEKKKASRQSGTKDLGSRRLHFIFFFSFLFFYFLFLFLSLQIRLFSSFFILFYFLDLDVIVLSRS